MPPHRGGPVDLTDADISFPLSRLFDPYNFDHIPENERLKKFKKRDLAHIKHYKAAVKIFGGPLSRKRDIVAPPMETPMKHRLGLYMQRTSPPPAHVLNSPLKPQIPKKPLEEEKGEEANKQDGEEAAYKKWIEERQKFRTDLEGMGLSEGWLKRKPDKTNLEKRVLRRMIKENLPPDEEPPPISVTPASSEAPSIPSVKVPSPLGIRILEKHLRLNKMRLIDLFTSTDKNKNWKLSRDEFRNAIRQSKVPMSEALLEDLILSLDMDCDDSLDYRELCKGMELWKKERRENRRKELSRESTSVSTKTASRSSSPKSREEAAEEEEGQLSNRSQKSGHGSGPKSPKSSQGSNKSQTIEKENSQAEIKRPISKEKEHRIGSGKDGGYVSGGSRTSTPQYLKPPEPDTRLDQMILTSEEAMVDLRKRDREALKNTQTRKGSPKAVEAPGIIKVGDKAIDDHCMKSTLNGETAEMVDKFRQLKLREFCEITKLCKEEGIPLNFLLLERVLLHPPDKPHNLIKKKVKMPGAPLLSSHYAEPPKRPRTPIEVKHKDKVRRSKSGKLLIDTRHQYPQKSTVAPSGKKMNLSTGKAIIRRQVDCWMTFEEYDRLTSHLAIRYQQLHGNTDDNAFWPGHLLEKVRLCMPPYGKPSSADNTGNSIFSRTVDDRIYRPEYQPRENSAWPVSEDGKYMQIGIHDPYARKHLPPDT